MSQDIFEEENNYDLPKEKNSWWENLFVFVIIGIFCISVFSKDNSKDFNPSSPIYYNTQGRLIAPPGSRVAIFDDYITPGQAMGNTIDYSAAHFITVPIITITAEQNTSSLTNIPLVSIATKSATNCTVNIVTSNSQVVSVLGATVTGLVAATGLSTMKLHIRAKGYTYDQ